MYHAACDMLRDCHPKVTEAAEEAEPDALACPAFPPAHWKRLRTNNVQERANREIKRRSRVVQVFPSERSLERLVGAVMCEQDEQRSASRYFAYDKMQDVQKGLEAQGIEVKGSELTMVPTTPTDVSVVDAKKVQRLVDRLDELEDVQNVYHTMNVTDEIAAALEEDE